MNTYITTIDHRRRLRQPLVRRGGGVFPSLNREMLSFWPLKRSKIEVKPAPLPGIWKLAGTTKASRPLAMVTQKLANYPSPWWHDSFTTPLHCDTNAWRTLTMVTRKLNEPWPWWHESLPPLAFVTRKLHDPWSWRWWQNRSTNMKGCCVCRWYYDVTRPPIVNTLRVQEIRQNTNVVRIFERVIERALLPGRRAAKMTG